MSDALVAVLEAIATVESEFTDRLYDRLFEIRPDAAPLFGAHSVAEKEEMLRETLRSVVGWMEREDWLVQNLQALGRSHAEYGVTDDMYASFSQAVIETIGSLDLWPSAGEASARKAVQQALDAITLPMKQNGGPSSP